MLIWLTKPRLLERIIGALPILMATSAAASPDALRRNCRQPNQPASVGDTICNDKFFLRASGYVAATHTYMHVVQVDGNESYTQRLTTTGFVAGADIMLGGTPAPGVLIGGFLGFAQGRSLNYTDVEGGTAEPGVMYTSRGRNQDLQRILLGPALALFPIPASGFVIDVRPAIGGVTLTSPFDLHAATYGLELGVGYELWLTPNFGMGLSVRGDFARLRENLAVQRGPDFTDGTFRSGGLAVTMTMH